MLNYLQTREKLLEPTYFLLALHSHGNFLPFPPFFWYQELNTQDLTLARQAPNPWAVSLGPPPFFCIKLPFSSAITLFVFSFSPWLVIFPQWATVTQCQSTFTCLGAISVEPNVLQLTTSLSINTTIHFGFVALVVPKTPWSPSPTWNGGVIWLSLCCYHSACCTSALIYMYIFL